MKPPSVRRRFQFSLRTLFVVTTLVAFGCAWFTSRVAAKQRERAAVAILNKNGWGVTYDYKIAASGQFDPTGQPAAPNWLRRCLGDDFFGAPTALFAEISGDSELAEVKDALQQMQTVKSFAVCGDESLTDNGLTIIAGLTNLESIEFMAGSGITDASIPTLKRLTKLRWLSLHSRYISERALRRLKMALPDCKIAELGDDEPSK